MLSRVADSLYWMSRYLERAEHAARSIDVNLNLTLDQSPAPARLYWRRLLRSLRLPAEDAEKLDAYQLTQQLTFDLANSQSLVACITSARENARQVREHLSSEMWEQLNRLFWQVKRGNIDSVWHDQPHEFFRGVKEGAHLFQGITDSTLAHGDGWHFILLGRSIERAQDTASLLDVYFSETSTDAEAGTGGLDYLEWVGLLKSCTAFEAYCQVYTADLRPDRIAEFLLLNAEFPRSVRFSVDMMQAALQAIGRATGARKAGRVERLAGRLRAALDYGQVDEIMAGDVHHYLEDVQRQCAQIHAAIYQAYIAYPIETALAS